MNMPHVNGIYIVWAGIFTLYAVIFSIEPIISFINRKYQNHKKAES